jgi:hypothetical protein
MKSKGVHRLSIGVGLLAAVIVFILILVEASGPFPRQAPFIIAGVEAVVFFLGWGAVRLGAWVVQGFAEDRRTGKNDATRP